MENHRPKNLLFYLLNTGAYITCESWECKNPDLLYLYNISEEKANAFGIMRKIRVLKFGEFGIKDTNTNTKTVINSKVDLMQIIHNNL